MTIMHTAALKAWATRRTNAQAIAATKTAKAIVRSIVAADKPAKGRKASQKAATKTAAAPAAKKTARRSGGSAATTGQQMAKMYLGVDTMPPASA